MCKPRTVVICSCGKPIKTREARKNHREMGHTPYNIISIENFKLQERQMEHMKYIIPILLLTMIITCGNAQQTVGKCLNNDQITYTTTFTLDGTSHTITDTETCTAGCQKGLTEHGDACSPVRDEIPTIPFVLWLFIFGVIIWFRRYIGHNLIPATLLIIWSLGGLLISQHMLMWIPIGITFGYFVLSIEPYIRHHAG